MTQLPTYTLGYAIDQENDRALQANGLEPKLMLKAAAENYPPFNTDTNPMTIVTLLDQANQGACQGFSLVRMFQICYYLMTGRILDFSAAAAYYLSQRYDGLFRDVGSTLSGGQKVALSGLCLAKEWPYPAYYNNTEPNPKPNYAFKLVASKPTKDPSLVREALDLGLPVQDGIKWNAEVSRTVCESYTGRGAGGGHSTTLWLKRNGNYIRINSWDLWDGDGCNENTPNALDQQVRLGGNNHVIYAPEGMIYPNLPPIQLPEHN